MLIAYAYCFGPTSGTPELCIIPSKPDQFSCMVRIHSLVPTASAVCRLSPTEGIKVFAESDPSFLVIEPIVPSKLFLTPSQPDRPGLEIKLARVKFVDDVKIDVFYKQSDKDSDWKPWRPNESCVG